MPYHESENRAIYYETLGQGDPIILVHGLACANRYWDDLPQFLSRNHTVITYDLRGHGKSFAPDTGYSYRDHVHDLKALITELGFTKISLFGHSLGGAIALKFALEHLGMIKSIMLEAPHVVGYKDYSDWPNVHRTARTIDIDQAKIQWEGFRLFSRLKPKSRERELFLQCLRDFPGKIWTDPQAGKYLDESDLALLDKITIPLLLLCGREDIDFLPLAKLINSRFVNGSLFEIPDCGHMIHLEKPEIVKREVATFLKI